MLVVGLGNPGPRYASTRHNVGRRVVEQVARRAGAVAMWRERFHGLFSLVGLAGERMGLLLPETFMNDSGRSVGAAASFYRLVPEEVVVVHDELDLALGELRLKQGGGEAGHRGLVSLSAHLGTADYARVRVGIGRPAPNFGGGVAEFVLEAFPLADRPVVEEAVGRAADAIELVAERGIHAAMNRVNRRNQE